MNIKMYAHIKDYVTEITLSFPRPPDLLQIITSIIFRWNGTKFKISTFHYETQFYALASAASKSRAIRSLLFKSTIFSKLPTVKTEGWFNPKEEEAGVKIWAVLIASIFKRGKKPPSRGSLTSQSKNFTPHRPRQLYKTVGNWIKKRSSAWKKI